MPDFEVQDAQGRKLRMSGDSPPTEADIDEAFTAAFAQTTQPTSQGQPGFVSRAKESLGALVEPFTHLPPDPRVYNPAAAGQLSETIHHPFKTAARAIGVNPDSLYNDVRALNIPAALGDVVVPGAALLAQHAPKAAGLVGDAMRDLPSSVRDIPASIEQIKKVRAQKAATQGNAAYFENLGKAIGPTAKSPAKDVMNKTAARPYLAAEHAMAPIEDLPRVVEAADKGIGTIQGVVQQAVDLHKDAPLPTNPLGDAVKAVQEMRGPRASDLPKATKELKDLGLSATPTVGASFDLIHRLNAENKGILAKNNYDVATVRAQDPTFVAREAAVDALRDGVYGYLESQGIEGIRQLRRDEGALISVRNAAQKQVFNGDKTVGGVSELSLPARIAAKGLRYGTGAATAATGYAAGGPLGGVLGVAVGGPVGEVLARKFVPRVTRNDLVKSAFKNLTSPKPAYPTIPQGVPPSVAPRPMPAVPPVVSPQSRLPLEPSYAAAGQTATRPASSGGDLAPRSVVQYQAPPPLPRPQLEARDAGGAPQGGTHAIPESYREHFTRLVPFAKAHGFTGSIDELAQHYTQAVEVAKQIAKEAAISPEDLTTSRDLLKAVKEAGGISIEAEGPHGMSGELEHLLESLHKGTKSTAVVKRGARAGQEVRLPPKQSGGVEGISGIITRKGHNSADRVLEHINQDPRWAGHFESLSEFVAKLGDAIFEETQGQGPNQSPHTVQDVMTHVLGITGDAKWWEQ